MRLGSSLLLLSLASARAHAQPSFEHLKWFQIDFCQKVNHLTVLPASAPGELRAYGFASDNFGDEGIFNYYEWDLLTGGEKAHVTFPGSQGISRIDFKAAVKDRTDRYALLLSSSHDVPLFDLQTKTVVQRFAGHRQESRHGALADDRRRVAVSDARNRIWIWRADAPDMPFQRIDPGLGVAHLAFEDGGAKLRAILRDEIRTYDVETGVLLASTPVEVELATYGFPPDSVSFTADGTRFLATVPTAPFVAMVDLASGKRIWDHDFGQLPPNPSFPPMPNWPKGAAYSPNGQCLIVGEWGGFRVFEPVAGTERFFQRHNVGSDYYVFSPDGRYLVSAGSCNLDVWRVPAPCAD